MAKQLDLMFEPQAAPSDPATQDPKAVGGKVAPYIRDFYALERQDEGGEWTMDDLYNFVRCRAGKVAPASCDRILRAMRAAGELNYEVIDRQKSLYRFVVEKADD